MKNPSGLCMCGCGQRTDPSPQSRRGYKRGESLRYIKGHSSRRQGPDYKVEARGFETRCWIWRKSIGSYGYGRIWNGTGHDMAHRAYYEGVYGPIPEGLEIHHLCDQPACVNPDHLLAVSRAEHMATDGRPAYGNPKAPVAA